MEKSFLQLQAESSRFDDDARRQQSKQAANANRSVSMPEPAPHLQDSVFAPSNPNADWGGHAPRPNARKQYGGGDVAKTNLVVGDTGFAPSSEAPIADGVPSMKKHYNHDISYQGVVQPGEQGVGPLGSNVYQMGPGGRRESHDWQTSNQIASGQSVPNEQYGEGKGPNAAGKKKIIPGYEQAKQGMASDYISPRIPVEGNSGQIRRNSRERYPSVGGQRSMLAGIGTKVMSREIKNNLPESLFEGAVASNDTGKNMLKENFHSNVPGYTGVRR